MSLEADSPYIRTAFGFLNKEDVNIEYSAIISSITSVVSMIVGAVLGVKISMFRTAEAVGSSASYIRLFGEFRSTIQEKTLQIRVIFDLVIFYIEIAEKVDYSSEIRKIILDRKLK